MKNQEARSVSQDRKGFTVGASPFNAVKLELGLILALAVIILLVVDKIAETWLWQVVILLTYGVGSAIWLGIRTRQITRTLLLGKQGLAHETE